MMFAVELIKTNEGGTERGKLTLPWLKHYQHFQPWGYPPHRFWLEGSHAVEFVPSPLSPTIQPQFDRRKH